MRAVCFLTSFLLYGIANSAIPLEGWYAGLVVGPTKASDLNFNLTNPFTGFPASGKLKYSTGINGGGQIGYRYDKFRSEAQFLFNQNNFNTVQVGNLSLTAANANSTTSTASFLGHTSFIAGMFNTYYEFYKEEVEVKFVPYVGLGIGYAQVSNSVQLFYEERQVFERNDTAYAPIGQVIAGLSYFFNDVRSISVDYRYTTTPKNEALNSSISIQSINFSVNFSFD